MSFSANAAFISGKAQLSNGNDVALQGLEWMPLTYTSGLSRTDIEDGFTDRFGNTWAADDWRYATRTETETLINSLWDGMINGWSVGNSVGAEWFSNNFGAIAYDTGYGSNRVDGKLTNTIWIDLDRSYFFFGENKECTVSITSSCYGLVMTGTWVGDFDLTAFNVTNGNTARTQKISKVGSFVENLGGDFNINSQNDAFSKISTQRSRDLPFGSLLVRDVKELPSPSVLSLFALGLIGIAVRRRRVR